MRQILLILLVPVLATAQEATSVRVRFEERRAVVAVERWEVDPSTSDVCHDPFLESLDDHIVGAVAFDRIALTEVIEFLRDNFDVNMMVDPEVTRGACDLALSLRFSNGTLRELLDLIVEVTKTRYEPIDGVLVILPGDPHDDLVTRYYTPLDTPAIYDGPIQGPPASILAEFIRCNVEPESWGVAGSIEASPHSVEVRHSRAVHARIRRLLSHARGKAEQRAVLDFPSGAELLWFGVHDAWGRIAYVDVPSGTLEVSVSCLQPLDLHGKRLVYALPLGPDRTVTLPIAPGSWELDASAQGPLSFAPGRGTEVAWRGPNSFLATGVAAEAASVRIGRE